MRICLGLDSLRPAEVSLRMKTADTLTPTLSRPREREQEREASVSGSLSRERERAGVRVRSRALRQGQTDAEALLWSKLRSRQLLNLKFRRQHPIGPYFADFACIEIGLVVELDGGQHAEDDIDGYDQRRSSDMAALGFQTLRFWNNDVLSKTEAVLEKIFQTAETLTPALSRKREREQENSKGTS
jgi:very-short-patch-repair endonuclease